MKKEEKGVDFKINISNDLLSWFLNESEAFYLLIDDKSKILSFSENSLIFFSLQSNYKIGKESISKFIGDENWQFLSSKINNFPNNTENALILPDQINHSYTIGAKWESYEEEDHNEEKKRVFIIFKHITEKKKEHLDLEYLETEDNKKFGYYKECLDLLEIPIAIINNNDFYYKNNSFTKIVQKENIQNFNSFFNWVKNNSINKDINLENLDNNLKIEIKKDEFYYLFTTKYFPSNNQFYLISLLKIEKEIIEKENINVINESKNFQNEIIEKFTNQVNDIKLELKKEYDNITENFNIDLESINNKINQNYKEYEKIITYTSENLISMTQNFNFIEEISVKIHLISINAAIESAKSGEYGKGFAVISKEIAKLSKEIKNYIKKIGNQINEIKEYTRKITIKEEIDSDKSPEKLNNIIKLVESTKSKLINLTYSVIEKINKLSFIE